MKEVLQKIVDKAGSFGLPNADITYAQVFLKNHEFGLCLETIVTQIYEYEIKIDEEFYQLVTKAAQKLKMPISNVDYIKTLLANPDNN